MSNDKFTGLAKFSEAAANLMAEYVHHAGGNKKAIEHFCNSFDIELQNPKERKKARKTFEALLDTIKKDKEGQKSGDDSINRIDLSTSGDRGVATESIFGAKKNSKTFIVDEMLATGKYTMNQIAKKSEVSNSTIERRIRELKKQGHECSKSRRGGRIGVSIET